MLRPRKNPLIDGPVIVGDGQRLRRWQAACIVLAALSAALVVGWPSTPTSNGQAVPDEVWWRRLISSIAIQRLAQSVDVSAAGEMKQRLAQLEAERVTLSERLAEAERLLKIDRSQQRLSQVVAQRKGKEIGFEVLLRAPSGSSPGERLTLDIMAVRNPVASNNSRIAALPLDIDRSTRLGVRSPKVAETIQGRLYSGASHLLVMLSSTTNASQTEALLVPVNGNK
ncbi:MAG: hypothetical protein EBS23_09140 [Betaproteobacteria bacterium]|nr:hypothetical protein [Betaproteobacteria bacterium]